MVEEMAGLGFKRIELSHGIRISLVPGILQAVEEGMVEISSIHNFCPLPNSVQHAAPNLYQPTAGDARERQLWRNYTLQTLEFAEKLGAPKIVIHSGSVWFFLRSAEAGLEAWVAENELKHAELAEHEAYRKRLGRALKRIERRGRKPMARLKENFESLREILGEKNLCLGIENREGLEELPVDAAHGDFVRSFDDARHYAYWHDSGHAEIKAQCGLLDHAERLADMAELTAGWHLHDVTEDGKDHQVPGTGVIDFGMIGGFIRPEHAVVLELSPSLRSEDVRQARDYILSTVA